jgi:hypothetical protein
MSTKNVLSRPWVEFVLGIDQVIKGFDRAIPLMSVGERSTIIISPEYACKSSLHYFGVTRSCSSVVQTYIFFRLSIFFLMFNATFID